MLASGPNGPEEHLGIWALSTLTGEIRKLVDDGWLAAFSPDARQVAYITGSNDEIWVTGSKGEDAHVVARAGPGLLFSDLAWSPDGQRFACIKGATANTIETVIEVRDLHGTAPAAVVVHPRIGALTWAPDGRLIYAQAEAPPNQDASGVWELRLDPRTARPVGEPRPVSRWLSQFVMSISVSADGRRIAVTKARLQSNVFVGQLSASDGGLTNVRPLTQDDRVNWPSGWTSDGRSVFFHSDRNGDFDLFRQGLSERIAQPLLLGAGDARAARISPDGQWMLYLSWVGPDARTGATRVRLMRMPVAGGAPSSILETEADWGRGESAMSAGDGNWTYPNYRCPEIAGAPCVIGEAKDRQTVFAAFDPVTGRKGEVARVEKPAESLAWDLSRDGSRLAYIASEIGPAKSVIVLTLADKTARVVPFKGWSGPTAVAWSPNGNGFFIVNMAVRGGTLLDVDLTGRVRVLRDLVGKGLFLASPRPSADGRYLAFGQGTGGSNTWILEARQP